ncbi:YjbQ family protein [Candidatus Bathyarchaeota archaeon]|nr:YjbQ family protein [Candidatus Bathyarchaeota archaeon]
MGDPVDVITKHLQFHVKKDEIKNITPNVRDALTSTGLSKGIVTIFVPGSTGAVSTLEYEPGLVDHDIPRFLQDIAPEGNNYAHHQTWGDHNGHSHVRAFFLKPDITVPFISGKLSLGTWQQIVFLNLDERGRTRNLILQFMGT